MDKYISIIFRFQLAIGTSVSEIPNIRRWSYFSYGIDSSLHPYPKPEKDKLSSLSDKEKFALEMGEELSSERRTEIKSLDNKYKSDLRKWEMECINCPEWRIELKEAIGTRLQEAYEKIIKSKNEDKLKVNRSYQFNYFTYSKPDIDCWLKIWSEINLEKESLENLLSFDTLRNNCLDEKRVKEEKRKLSEEERKTYQFFRDDARQYTNNSYEEGGGGDEWSDSSSFW